MKRSREMWILAVILLVGALLRGLYLAETARNLSFYLPGVDAGYHDFWARGLVTGQWASNLYGDPEIQKMPFFRPPGYPYFLALVYKLSGCSFLFARVIQMLIGLLSAFVAFLLGRRWFGARMGLIFAGLMSVYWVFIYFEGELLEPVLLVILSLLLIYELALWTERITFRRALLAGIIMGVFALVRPNVLLFAPVALLWALWIVRRRRDVKPFKLAVIGVALGSVLVISPATIRNYIVARDFVPISTNSGINLYIGNNPTANGRVTGIIPGLGAFQTCFDYPQLVRNLEAKLGRRLKHSEVSKYFSDEAIAFMESHPGDALRLTGTRALLFWGPKEVGHNKEDELERANSGVLRRIPGGFPAALALSVIGTAFWLTGIRRGKDASAESQTRNEVLVLVWLFVITYFVSYLPFFVAGRYRAPVVPFLLLLGAWGIDRMISLVAERRFGAVGLWLALFAAAYALASANPTGYAPDLAFWHYSRGVELKLAGKIDPAAQEYSESLRIKPDFPLANVNLGLIRANQGRFDEAVEHFSRVLDVLPDDAWAHYGMGLALAGKGNFGAAIREFETATRLDPSQYMGQYHLGTLLFARGNLAGAEGRFIQALKGNPEFAPGYVGLAMIYEARGRWDKAISHYAEAVKFSPDPFLHSKLANLYARTGRFDEAAAQFSAVIRLNPKDPLAHYNLALAFERLGKLDEAIAEYSKAVEIRPDLAKAHKNLAVALYFKGDYSGAWREVNLCRKYGGTPHPEFIKALSRKLAK